ncbi:hypothetical protein B0H13DRAFT_2324107 [Mycena leptocephala]|nr:hypothetical protein B0H13DRAFT_2324107 [Mycena leptocephala]
MAAQSSVIVILEDHELPPFHEEEWIGRSKTYPSSPPPELDAFCKRKLLIPQGVVDAFPHNSTNVVEFLRVKLPGKGHGLVFPAATGCFSQSKPTTDVAKTIIYLKTTKLPPAKYIGQVQAAANQAILDGQHPLAYLSGDTTLAFTRIASDRMLSDGGVDCMVAKLQQRISEEPKVVSRVLLVQRPFILNILKATGPEHYKERATKYLQTLEDKLKNGTKSELWFLALWKEQKHWLTFKCDFQALTLSYGDPLKMPGKPQEIINKTLWWLKGRFNKHFKCMGDTLPCGCQNDAISCGVIAVNTMSHNILGDDVWTLSRKLQDRINWFNILCEQHKMKFRRLSLRLSHLLGDQNEGFDVSESTAEPRNNEAPKLSRLLNPDIGPVSMTPNTMQRCSIDDVDVNVEEPEPRMIDVEMPDAEGSGPSGAAIYSVFAQAKEQANVAKRKVETADSKSKAVILHPIGTSKTAVWEQRANVEFEKGTLPNVDSRMATFKITIEKLDKFADVIDPKSNAIKIECPDDDNYKYNNHKYRGNAKGVLYAKCVGLKEIIESSDSNTPALRYAKGVLSGKYKGDTFLQDS